jgi:multiple sugar transport system substrate-binding protein
VPAYLKAEAGVVATYESRTNARATLLPVGLGARGDQFTLIYQDTFERIVMHNEDIQTVLKAETGQLQALLNAATAPCWAPDPPSGGPCQIS